MKVDTVGESYTGEASAMTISDKLYTIRTASGTSGAV